MADGDGAASPAGGYEPPVAIELPQVAPMAKARRLARTGVSLSRHLLPGVVRIATSRAEPIEIASRTRRAFEELGATYVKFGQFVGSASDLVGPAVSHEFRSCLDTGPAVPFPAVRRVVEKATGRPLEESFATFEPSPFAAASIAVVHRAMLLTGEAVAVKVLRPGMEETIAADLSLLQWPVRLVARQGSDRAMDVLSYLIGLEEQVAEELDLRNEARSMDYFRGLFADLGLALLVVPRVYHALSSRRVLTMELLEGAPIDDLARISALGLDPKPFVREVMRAWILTALRLGTFHADIHAGNLLLTREGKLGVLDWGIVARLDPDTHGLVGKLLEAALGIESAWDAIAAHFMRLQGATLREGLGLNDEQIKRLVRSIMEPVLTQPVGEVSMASLFGTSEEAVMIATGAPRPARRSLRERWRLIQKARRTNRLKLARGELDTGFQRASFLAGKQLLYLERYWKAYMPDEPLLGDHEFLRAVLAHDTVPAETSAMPVARWLSP